MRIVMVRRCVLGLVPSVFGQPEISAIRCWQTDSYGDKKERANEYSGAAHIGRQ